MNAKKLSLACLIALDVVIQVEAQSTFRNLGFESASLVAIPGDPYQRVQFNSALPGWVAYCGGVQQTVALYNGVFLDSSGVSIIDNRWPHSLGPTAGLIEGRFTAILQAGFNLNNPVHTPADTTLSQTSLVPINAGLLQFRAYTPQSFGFDSLRVFLGGVLLDLSPMFSGTNYTLFGADVQAWQGQIAQLDFTVLAQRPHVDNVYVFLDSIQFQPTPEPGVFALIGLGALCFGWRLSGKLKSQAVSMQ